MKVEFKSIMDEIKKIKEMFETKQVFAQATLEDGTVVEWEGDLVAGTELFVVDGETRIPAPIGTHTTTEGLQVVVEEVGIVAEVIEAVVEEEAKAEDFENVPATEIPAVLERVTEVIAEKLKLEMGEAYDVASAVIEAINAQMETGLSKDEVEAVVNEKMSAVTKVMDDLLKVAESTQRELETFKAQPSVSEREKTKLSKEGGDLTPRQKFLLNNFKK